MKKFLAYFLLLSTFNCWAVQASLAQQTQSPTATESHREKAERLRREAEREERLQQADDLLEQYRQAVKADNEVRIKELKSKYEELVDQGAAANSNAKRAFREAAEEPSESPTPAPSGVTPGTAAAMTGPTEREVLINTPVGISKSVYGLIDPVNAELFNPKYARQLLKQAIHDKVLKEPSVAKDKDQDDTDPIDTAYTDINAKVPPETIVDEKDFHCIIHILRWKDPENKDAQTNAQTIEKQNWYVYNNGKAKGYRGKWSQDDFASKDRLFGVKRVWLLYIHLNKWQDRYYAARYDFDITKKTPANLANLFSVAQLIATVPSAITDVNKRGSGEPENVWGGGAVDMDYVPSEISVTAKFVPLNPKIVTRDELIKLSKVKDTGWKSLDQESQDKIKKTLAKIDQEVNDKPSEALDKPRTYHNEGLYWWDVSVAVPIRRISQLEFNGTDSTLAPKKVDKQNIFALLNLYPIPEDITGKTYSWIPHFVGGVAIAKQPQNKILVGASFGPRFANFYLGSLWVKQQEAQDGTGAQNGANITVRKRYRAQFSFGLNLPVRGVVDALKPKENPQ